MRFFMFLMAVSSTAFAADYKHCTDYINSKGGGATMGMWKVDSAGKVDTNNIPDSVLHLENNGVHVFKGRGMIDFGDGVPTLESTVTTKEGIPVEIVNKTSNKKTVTSESTMKLVIKNDVCFPEKLVGKASPDFPNGFKAFDVNLCHDLAEFVAKSPEARACNCGNERTNKAILGMFKKHDRFFDSRKIEQNKEFQDASWKAAAKQLNQPIVIAYDEMEMCEKIDGVSGAVKDSRLWSKADSGSGPSADEPDSTVPAK